MGIVSIQNVSFSYQKDSLKQELSDVSLEIQQGECILLCGKSGSGKTTITKLINGLIPHFDAGLKSGSVFLDGIDTEKMPVYQISLKVASIFQDPKSQFFNIEVEDEIVFSLENKGTPINIVEERLAAVIQDLNLHSLVKKHLFEMSGGEKQIIAFACAYALNPDIIVMDEPSSNLDLGAIEIIRNILGRMKSQGKTLIIAEHRFSYLADLIDRAVFVEKGEIKANYTGKQFFGLTDQQRKDMGLRRLAPCAEVKIQPFMNQPAPPVMHFLDVKNIEIAIGEKVIFKDISFSLKSGDIAAIVGANGVGKTTLCRTICGFLESRNGQIIIDGAVMRKRKRLKRSYIVMQDTNYQLFAESVMEECFLGNPSVSEAEVRDVLKRLDLTEVSEHHPQSLSGGQKQRLAIAVAILAKKDVIVFDEPTSGLDYASMIEVSRLMKELSQMGIIILLITHDMEFLETTCNQCFYLCTEGIQKIQRLQTDKLFYQMGQE